MRRAVRPVTSVRRAELVAALAASVLLVGATVRLGCQNAPRPVGTPPAPDSEPWRLIQPPQSSLVFARDGSLIGEIGREWRTSVPLQTLPKYVGEAFIAIEDKRFYQHNGVDVIGFAGALKDLLRGEARGGSTITQQLVGNMHPTIIDRRDRSPGRKLREQAAAREMEQHYTKAQILEAYLNQIIFGHGWYGIEAASRHYFGKSASKLTLSEAASLAALPRNPVYYDPARHPDHNRLRRNTVLALMAQQGFITKADAEASEREPLVTAPNDGMSVFAPYFIDAVQTQLERAGVSVADGGYRVFTTLDPELQRAAQVALEEGTAAVEMRPGYRHPTFATHARGAHDYLEGAVVALDGASGEVRALIGGRNYAASPFDRAVNAVRQPGSAFKPIVYAVAIADSIPPNVMVADTSLAIPLPDHTVYSPSNADGKFLGPMTLREALVDSRNPVAVELGIRVGMDSVIALARRVGISTPIADVPSSAIGASAVRPLDFVAAFAAFANLGTAVEPRLLLRVEDDGGRTTWAPHPAPPLPALDPAVAFIVRDMMRDVVERGTAKGVRRYLPSSIPAAGKTGTTNDNSDVWFVGMTPELVAGVWLGFDTPQTITPGAVGGSLAAPVWAKMMATYYADHTAGAWVPPAGVVSAELDRQTGELADTTTPPARRYTEYFLDGTEPGALRFDPWSLFRWGPIAATDRPRRLVRNCSAPGECRMSLTR